MRSMDSDKERLLRLAYSPAYRAFGFGTEAMGFAKRLLALNEERPDALRKLFDVADRVVFTDFLRFEIAWEADRLGGNISDRMRYGDNLDALETHLLCTCIDALSTVGHVVFPNWVAKNPEEVTAVFAEMDAITPQQYPDVTARLFDSYNKSAGLSYNFRRFFVDMPDFLKRELADGLFLIKGDYWTENGQRRVEAWRKLSVDQRVERIARDYLWGVRRSSYSHSCNRQVALVDGRWRRMAEIGDTASEPSGWKATALRSAKDPDRVEWTLISETSKDEGFLLRAVIATGALTTLGYSVDGEYLGAFLLCYKAIETIYTFLDEIVANREWLDLLMIPQAIDQAPLYESRPLPSLSTTVGERLLRDFPSYVSIFARQIGSYVRSAQEVNTRIEEFNHSQGPRPGDWKSRRDALAAFAHELLPSSASGWLHWYEQLLRPSLKRHVESGQVFYRFAGIVQE